MSALLAGCAGEIDYRAWDNAPARTVAYNRYVPAGAIRFNPRRNSGVAYLYGGARSTTTTTTTVYGDKEVVEIDR